MNYKNNVIVHKTIIIALIIFTCYSPTFAINEVSENINNNEQNTNQTNEVRQLTLQEQRNQVNEQLASSNEQLTYVESELSEKTLEIARLQDRIIEYEKQLAEVNAKYQQIQEQVKQAENQLNKIQEIYTRKDKLLKDRLVTMYKRGSTNYIDVLLNSRNIIEFISNYYMVQVITKYDSQELKEINDKKMQIQKITNELVEKKASMKIIKAQAEKQTVILTNTKTIVENEKNSLDESEKKILAEIDSYKKQEEEINNLILYSISASTYELQYSGGTMMWPTLTSSYITSPFGSRLHPIQGIVKNHAGIDIGGKIGDPVYAASEGVVIYSANNGDGYGNKVLIDHGYNEEGVKIVTLYGHGNKLLKNIGDTVAKGDIIMEMGSTGNSTGPHLHFEVLENGTAIDPKKYLSSSY